MNLNNTSGQRTTRAPSVRIDVTWLDTDGVQQHAIGRLVHSKLGRMRVLLALQLQAGGHVHFRAQNQLRGRATVLECTPKGKGFVVALDLYHQQLREPPEQDAGP